MGGVIWAKVFRVELTGLGVMWGEGMQLVSWSLFFLFYPSLLCFLYIPGCHKTYSVDSGVRLSLPLCAEIKDVHPVSCSVDLLVSNL